MRRGRCRVEAVVRIARAWRRLALAFLALLMPVRIEAAPPGAPAAGCEAPIRTASTLTM